MAADLVFALWKPFKYKKLNHRLFHMITAISCFSFRLTSSLFDCFRMFVQSDGDMYKIETDKIYLSTTLAVVLSQMRMVVHIIGLFGMIGLNIAMTFMFRKRSRKVAQMTNNDQKEKARKEADKTLLC